MGEKLVSFFVAFVDSSMGMNFNRNKRPNNRPVNSGFLLVLFF